MSSGQNEQVKLRKRLEALLKLPDNQTCADCRKRGPRWASANLGIFICIECSGIHRNLGVHISFVRSVNLDSWTKQQVEFMEEWGNGRANEYWEGNLPNHVLKPKEGDPVRVVERFIRDKYEFRKYIANAIPPKHDSNVEADIEPEPVVAKRASKHHGHHHGHHSHHGHHTHPKQEHSLKVEETPKSAAPVPAPAPAAPSLLDFMDDPAPAPPAPATQVNSIDPFGSTPAFPPQHPAPVAAAPAPAFDPFAAPVPVQTAAPNVAQMNGQPHFGNTNPAPMAASGFDFVNPAQPAQPQQPPKASADAILSLYSNNMNRGGPAMPMPMGGGFNQQMYPPNHQPPMLNMHPNHGMPQYGQPPMGYPPQQPQYPGMNFQQGPPPMNPFAPPGGMPMQPGGYPPQNYQQFQQQPPANPFRPNPGMPGGMPMNAPYPQGGWQR